MSPSCTLGFDLSHGPLLGTRPARLVLAPALGASIPPMRTHAASAIRSLTDHGRALRRASARCLSETAVMLHSPHSQWCGDLTRNLALVSSWRMSIARPDHARPA